MSLRLLMLKTKKVKFLKKESQAFLIMLKKLYYTGLDSEGILVLSFVTLLLAMDNALVSYDVKVVLFMLLYISLHIEDRQRDTYGKSGSNAALAAT